MRVGGLLVQLWFLIRFSLKRKQQLQENEVRVALLDSVLREESRDASEKHSDRAGEEVGTV